MIYKGFFKVFTYDIHRPFYRVGIYCTLIAYALFVIYGVITPLYGTDSVLASASLLAGLGASSVYILFSALVILTIASMLFAYIEIGRHNQQIKFLTTDRVTLEVRLPQGLFKGVESLHMMEEMLDKSITQFGEAHWFNVWKGERRTIYSFEIVSRGGKISFFVNIPKSSKQSIEEALYSSFIGLDVSEAEDYVYDIECDDRHTMNAFEWSFGDREESPVQSYVDMKRNNAEVNPLKGLYELFSSIESGEQMWVQYVVSYQKYKEVESKYASNPIRRGHWDRKEFKEKISAFISEMNKKEEEKETPSPLSENEQYFKNTAAPRLMNKKVCNVGIRMVYIASKESYKKRWSDMMGVYAPVKWHFNFLKPNSIMITMRFNKVGAYTKLGENRRLDKEAEQALQFQLYRDRLFWLAPALYTHRPSDSKIIRKKLKKPSAERKTMTMTVETLATLCHLPMTEERHLPVRHALSDYLPPPGNLPLG